MLQIILVQDFCPLKIKITQCPGGFRLNVLFHQFLVIFTDIWIKRTGHFPVFGYNDARSPFKFYF